MKTLKINEECWIEYKRGIYQGIDENNNHIVKITTKDSETLLKVKYDPIPLSTFSPPILLSKRNTVFKYCNNMTARIRNGSLVLFYEYKCITSPRSSDYFRESEISELQPINQDDFWDEDKIQEELDLVNNELRPIRKQISELRDEEQEILKKKDPIYEKCLHSWEEVGDAQETGKNCLGMGYSQEYECSICGKNYTSYYTRL